MASAHQRDLRTEVVGQNHAEERIHWAALNVAVISQRSAWLLCGAIAIGGLLAGADFDRIVVGMPAWRQVGVAAWAAYSRHADLGAGLVAYPVEAIGAALLTWGAAISFYVDRVRTSPAAVLVFGSALLAAAGLVLTLEAAPLMLCVPEIDDPQALEAAFDGFYFWSSFRAVAQLLAFLAQCAAGAVVLSRTPLG